MIDPQFQLAQAIAHARSQQLMQPQQASFGDPHAIHQMASSLAQRIAAARQPIGRATVGMFPQAPPQQAPGGVGYAPNGNPGDYVPSGSPEAGGDYGFFVRPNFTFARPNQSPLNTRMMIGF